jgi:SulP family sulfate permease
MDAGCHFCEEHFLAAARQHGLCSPQAPCLTLAEVLRAHLELPRCILGSSLDYEAAASRLELFMERRELR